MEPLRPPLRDRQVHATAAGEDGRGRGVFVGLELKIADPALPDMRSLPRFASYDRYAASIEAAYTILSRLNMHDVQFSQARLGTHPLRGADCSRFYNAVMREVQISAAMVDAARNALNNALELRQIAETVW